MDNWKYPCPSQIFKIPLLWLFSFIIFMLTEQIKQRMYKQGYRFVGEHSAVKVCNWCKNALRGRGTCYKHKFYGIRSWRCVQMSPAADCCNLRCRWCWRDISHADVKWHGAPDDPKLVVEKSIKAHKELLMGFKGYRRVDKKLFEQAMHPAHFAISLIGEPTMYPLLPELLKEIHSRGMTTFVVSNATQPAMIKRMLREQQPTQMYITLPAPDEKTFVKACSPVTPELWQNIITSAKMLKRFNRSTVRLTLTKGLNLHNPEGYATHLEQINPDFIEAKAFMPVGFSRNRLSLAAWPTHAEIKEFVQQLSKLLDYHIISEQKSSRVVLLWNGETEPMIDFSGTVLATDD
jgi:tRNA wybutosine-synthesizing protein 1